MLEKIRIKQFALIDQTEIELKPGLNVLSGETGAGKSIVLEAIGLILGGRANTDVIRNGSDEAIVDAVFEISKRPWINERLQDLGIDPDEDHLCVRRVIHRSGKNKIQINGQTATVGMLQKVCEDLVDLCGQHENQSLFKPNIQVEWIDHFGKLESKVQKVRDQVTAFQSLCEQKKTLSMDEQERMQKIDFLKFQVQELKDANLQVGEDETLAQEKKYLQSQGQRIMIANAIQGLLVGDTSGASHGNSIDGAQNSLRILVSKAKNLSQLDESAISVLHSLERSLMEIDESVAVIDRYLGTDSADPERLNVIQERLSLIINLKRKYGSDLDEIISKQEVLENELNDLQCIDSRLAEIDMQIDKIKKELQKSACELADHRKKSAALFERAVTKELQELNMASARFFVSIESEGQPEDYSVQFCGSRVIFEAQTNGGEGKKPIVKLLSGGEMSRILLAIRRVLSDRGKIGVYLFDEIDAGLGGQTAFVVGKKLKTVSKHNQVICITHVPQVACFADHHVVVSKRIVKGRTISEIDAINLQGRREEIARMLGAEKITPSALKNADEMIRSASV